MQSHVQSDELKIILALEPAWTVSINGTEFVPASTSDIDVDDTTIRFGKLRRRILNIEWLRPNIPRVQVRTRLRAQPDVLTFYPGNRLPSVVDIRRRRRAFQAQLALALGIPAKGISGPYLKFIRGDRAVIAVDAEESTPVINGIMRTAILWSKEVRQRISVVVPAHRSRTIVTRLHAIPVLQNHFAWLQWDGEAIRSLNMDLPDPETHVHDYQHDQPPQVRTEVARICALAPNLLQAVPHIPGNAISIRLRGLEIARVADSGTTYPMGEPLPPLIESLAEMRRHGSRHPLARAYEERWLESNLIRQIQDLLPVGPEWIYPQVPSFVGEDRNIIDLLTVTEHGRLVVIEVKASADPDLPFQAFDYWLAVERHRKAGDFQAKGYFRGIDIRDEPALLAIVAPLLEFHRTLDGVLSVLPRNLPLMQIGINQSWKREIKILRRKGTLG